MKIGAIQHPLIIAHRGYSKQYPENTLVAFQAALDANADMIELDVTLTRDRKIVVIHDDTLERTTNGRGPVSDYCLNQLKALDAGSWFDTRFSGERIPTLEEVFDLVNSRIWVNIEIKSSAYEAHYPIDAIERQVIELVRQKDMQDTVIISSFEWKILENIKQISESPAISLLSSKPADLKAVIACQKLNAFSWHQNQKNMERIHVAMMHEADTSVFAYTVNSVSRFKQLLALGVDGVFTNDPVLLRFHSGL